MGQTTLVVIIVGSLVGFALLVLLILSLTLTPERAEALGTVFSGLTRLVQGIRGKKDGEGGGEKTREREESKRADMERGFASGALAAIASILPTKTQDAVSRTEQMRKTDATAAGDMVIRDKESAKNTKSNDPVSPPEGEDASSSQNTASTGTMNVVTVRPKESAATSTATKRDDST